MGVDNILVEKFSRKMIFTGFFLGAAHAQDNVNDAYLNCISVNGLNGTISNPREPCSLSQEGCYASGQDYCWRVQSSCKTIRARFNKFIVEEYMSGKDDCPYDKVLLSWSGNFVELCDHSAASKGGQGKIFNPNKDPENLGWLDWTSMDTDEFFIELKTDASIDFYGFDLEWECEEFTTTSTTTSTTTTSTTTTSTTVEATTTSPVTEMDTTLMERKNNQVARKGEGLMVTGTDIISMILMTSQSSSSSARKVLSTKLTIALGTAIERSRSERTGTIDLSTLFSLSPSNSKTKNECVSVKNQVLPLAPKPHELSRNSSTMSIMATMEATDMLTTPTNTSSIFMTWRTSTNSLLTISSLDAMDVLNWPQRHENWASFILLLIGSCED